MIWELVVQVSGQKFPGGIITADTREQAEAEARKKLACNNPMPTFLVRPLTKEGLKDWDKP